MLALHAAWHRGAASPENRRRVFCRNNARAIRFAQHHLDRHKDREATKPDRIARGPDAFPENQSSGPDHSEVKYSATGNPGGPKPGAALLISRRCRVMPG